MSYLRKNPIEIFYNKMKFRVKKFQFVINDKWVENRRRIIKRESVKSGHLKFILKITGHKASSIWVKLQHLSSRLGKKGRFREHGTYLEIDDIMKIETLINFKCLTSENKGLIFHWCLKCESHCKTICLNIESQNYNQTTL